MRTRCFYSLAIGAMFLTACDSEAVRGPALVQRALGQGLSGESEPNGSTVSATPIDHDTVVRARIVPVGDIDLYRFEATAGDRVFAATMTEGSSAGIDSTLRLLASDGTTVLETDLDNGNWNLTASSIAGAAIPSSGTYYIEVSGAGGAVRAIASNLV